MHLNTESNGTYFLFVSFLWTVFLTLNIHLFRFHGFGVVCVFSFLSVTDCDGFLLIFGHALLLFI